MSPHLVTHRPGHHHLFGIYSCLCSVGVSSPCGHRISPGSVPFSAGTKGLECSPSTPTMNSYFYKFMINLLKRFSSERRLLEARGAFIIRLAVVFHFHAVRGFRATIFSFASLAAFPDLCVLERKKVPPFTPSCWCYQHEAGEVHRFLNK